MSRCSRGPADTAGPKRRRGLSQRTVKMLVMSVRKQDPTHRNVHTIAPLLVLCSITPPHTASSHCKHYCHPLPPTATHCYTLAATHASHPFPHPDRPPRAEAVVARARDAGGERHRRRVVPVVPGHGRILPGHGFFGHRGAITSSSLLHRRRCCRHTAGGHTGRYECGDP